MSISSNDTLCSYVSDANDAAIHVFWASTDPVPVPAGHSNGPVLRDCFMLELCLSGHGTLHLNEQSFPMAKGQLAAIFPGSILTEKADQQDPWKFTWVLLKGAFIEQYLKSAGFTRQNPIFPIPPGPKIPEYFEQLTKLNDQEGEIPSLRRLAILSNMFADLIAIHTNQEVENIPALSPSSYVDTAIRFIHANYHRKLKISEIAQHLGLNRSYFFTLFKDSVGISPQEFLIQFRIQKACSFFTNPNVTVSDVAYSVGYDPMVFSQIFKKIMGESPSHFQKRIHPKTGD